MRSMRGTVITVMRRASLAAGAPGRAVPRRLPVARCLTTDGDVPPTHDPPTEKQIQFANRLATEVGVELTDKAFQSKTDMSQCIEELLKESKQLRATRQATPIPAVAATPVDGDRSGEPRRGMFEGLPAVPVPEGTHEEPIDLAAAVAAEGALRDTVLSGEQLKYTVALGATMSESLELRHFSSRQSLHGLALSLLEQSRATGHYDEACTLVASPSFPTERQLRFVLSLCQNAGRDLPAQSLTDREGTSAVIEELLGADSRPSKAQVDYMVSIAQALRIGIPPEALLDRAATSSWISGHQPAVQRARASTAGDGAPTGRGATVATAGDEQAISQDTRSAATSPTGSGVVGGTAKSGRETGRDSQREESSSNGGGAGGGGGGTREQDQGRQLHSKFPEGDEIPF